MTAPHKLPDQHGNDIRHIGNQAWLTGTKIEHQVIDGQDEQSAIKKAPDEVIYLAYANFSCLRHDINWRD